MKIPYAIELIGAKSTMEGDQADGTVQEPRILKPACLIQPIALLPWQCRRKYRQL
jgi:hypothetical protein